MVVEAENAQVGENLAHLWVLVLPAANRGSYKPFFIDLRLNWVWSVFEFSILVNKRVVLELFGVRNTAISYRIVKFIVDILGYARVSSLNVICSALALVIVQRDSGANLDKVFRKVFTDSALPALARELACWTVDAG